MFGVVAAPTNDPGASCRKTKLKENDIRFQFWLVFRAYFVAPPSRRLSGGRLARLRARDALATAGKMPALLSLAQRFRIHVIEKPAASPRRVFVQESLLCTD